MAMPRKVKNKYNSSSSPPVVSTNCSSLKSFYSSFRSQFSCSDPSSHRYLPINPTSRKPTSSSRQVYRESAQQFEHELAKLDELLRTEEKPEDGIDDFHNIMGSGIIEDKAASSCGKFISERKEILKLGDGGYLRYLLGGNSAMQVSTPALIPVEIGSSFSQVINRMASMGRDNLIKWLLKSMPICDLSETRTGIDASAITAACSDEGLLAAVLIEGVEKLETLALEGLKAQMSGKLKVRNEKAPRGKKVEFEVGYGLIEVMLIQMIDPTKRYERIGETMIGFIEASFGKREENCLQIEAIHVAGSGGERNECGYLWSVSTRNLGEGSWRRGGDTILRNPDIALT